VRCPCGVPCVARQVRPPHKLARPAYAVTCSNIFVGLPLTRLRYSAAHRGMKAGIVDVCLIHTAHYALRRMRPARAIRRLKVKKYYPPEYQSKQFHCIHCDVYAAQSWHDLYFINQHNAYSIDPDFKFCVCGHCKKWSYWYKKQMMVPSSAPVPPAHIDMPQECLAEYEEARNIVVISPRAASALLRLALQKLMVVLGEKGRNINDDIGELVRKGLPVLVQQALDFCRVVGNNAVHPGEIEMANSGMKCNFE